MCGIVACVQLDGHQKRHDTEERLRCSLKHLHHRGPDNQHVWQSEDGRVSLGHARLSIRDLSERGHQPLVAASNGIVIVVNGELYGLTGLRQELASDYQFQSRSDSELLIPLYLKYGTSLFPKLRGEFSFCLYDSRHEIFIAARDRYGVKPLHWTVQDGELLVASEAKAFKGFGWRPEWDVRSIVEDGWLHDERSLFKGIRKLRPGYYLSCSSFEYVEQRQYWDLDYPHKHVVDLRSESEMIQGVRDRLIDAVSVRLESDVPVGLYLSGGIDSSVVAGILNELKERSPQARSSSGPGPSDRAVDPETSISHADGGRQAEALANVTCFTVGFGENTGCDESQISKRTADWLELPLVTVTMDEARLAKHFEEATYHSEHHNADLQYIGKFLLSRTAREHGYRVILSGEGSDEHFGGYPHFLPDFLREPDYSFPHGQTLSGKQLHEEAGRRERSVVGYKGSEEERPNDKKDHAVFDNEVVARRMVNDSSIVSNLWRISMAAFAPWTADAFGAGLSVRRMRANTPDGRILSLMNQKWHPLHTSQYIFTRSILANAILACMGDRMEMAHSIEGRPPFLDHHLTEYLNGLPPNVKIKHVGSEEDGSPRFVEKWILREAARPYITDELYNRKKHPFTAPAIFQKGGPMHQLMQRLVTRKHVENLGFLDWDRIEQYMDEAFADVNEPQTLGESAIGARMCATRIVFTTAQFITLSQKFGVARASPPRRSSRLPSPP